MYFDTDHVPIFHEMDGQQTVFNAARFTQGARARESSIYVYYLHVCFTALLNSKSERSIRIRFANGKG